jgi:hypothetical protein
MKGRPPLWNKPRAKRDHPATPEQVEAWRKCRPGDIIQVRLRTGNVQRFVVCVMPSEFKVEPGQVHAQKYGQGINSAIRRISAFEIVL